MKTFYYLLVFFSFSLLAAVPKIEFEYASVFDSICERNSNFKIFLKEKEAAMKSNSSFQQSWNKNGSKLLNALYKITGKTFYRKELTIYTTVCNYVPMSEPLLLNVRQWINKSPKSVENNVVQMTFHEFIHKYLKAHWNWHNSKLLYTYKNESPGVKSHLHLMALEKAVYLSLGDTDLMQVADKTYTEIIKGDYLRSWEVIGREGHKKFVNEVKSNLK